MLEEAAEHGNQGDLRGASAIADAVTKLDANNAAAYLVHGVASRKLGDYSRALEDIGKALRINPKFAEAYCQRAFVHQQSQAEGSVDKAFNDASRAIELDRSLPLAFILRGNAYSDRRQFSQAVSDLTRAIELNPNSYSAYGSRSGVFASLGDTSAALNDIETAMNLNPPNTDLEQLILFRDALLQRTQEP